MEQYIMKNIKVFLTVILVVLILPVLQYSASAEAVEVSTYEELVSAVNAAKGETHIVLKDSLAFARKGDEPQIVIPAGSQVVLETSGEGIVLSHEIGGEMFYVEAGAKLTLKGHQNARLTLRETVLSEEWSKSCVVAEGSFEANCVDFEGFFAENGAAVFLNDKEEVLTTEDCVLEYCSLSGNHALHGGAIYIGTGRKAEINASSFTSNTATEEGNDIFVAGTLTYGDNNILSAYGPLNYEIEPDGSFLYAGQIYGTGTFILSERTSVSGVISWSMDSIVPESVQVVLLANGAESSTKTVTADNDGYWAFTFDNLPVKDEDSVIQYDIGEYTIPGFRFSKRGEADVGFELLYVAYSQEASADTGDISNGQVTSEGANEDLLSVAEDSPDAVSVTKNPTDEKAEIGGQAIFIAKANNYTKIIWHLVSPDGKEDYRDEEMRSAFSSLELDGLGTERLKIKVIPLSLNGWKIKAEFSGVGGPAFSEDAVITIEGADEKKAESVQETGETSEHIVQEKTGEETLVSETVKTDFSTETPAITESEAVMVELKKSPTNEHADLGGNAIFIARADHAQQIIWHILSPDDTVDYEDEQILNAFDGIQIEGLGTEKIKIMNIPVAMNGWKVQAEFIGEANRVLSDKAAILINNFEGVYQDEPQTGITEQSEALEETNEHVTAQSVEISPVLVEKADNSDGTTVETYISQATASDTLQRTINVVSLWNDSSNAAGKRPAMTIVELYRDEALYFTAVLNDSNSWMYSFSNLPEGSYKIKENEIPDYTVSYSVIGETVTVMHSLTEMDGQQFQNPTSIQSSASNEYTEPENSAATSSTPVPEVQATEITEPTTMPSPVPEQAVHQQSTEVDERELSGLSSSDRQNSKVMLLVGILGGAGLLCAVAAIYLIRKMK
jgi:hypothetical protein